MTGKQGGVLVDWLRFTFLPVLPETEAIAQLFQYLRLFISLPVAGKPSDKGMRGYQKSWDISVYTDGEWVRIGIIAAGGANVGGTILFDLSGRGCALVTDWTSCYSMMQDLDARITRCDLALDFLDGQVTIEDIEELYFSGQFNSGGRIPKYYKHSGGTFHDKDCNGRTFEIGRRVNGKMFRGYEKGRQLGNPDSKWFRLEVELGNRDRVIPHQIVLRPAEFFSGSHKALASFVDVASERIKTISKQAEMTLDKSEKWIRESAGKHIDQLIKHRFPFLADFVKAVRVTGLPSKLIIPALATHMIGTHDPVPIPI
jgi:phage replication initiation protein